MLYDGHHLNFRPNIVGWEFLSRSELESKVKVELEDAGDNESRSTTVWLMVAALSIDDLCFVSG